MSNFTNEELTVRQAHKIWLTSWMVETEQEFVEYLMTIENNDAIEEFFNKCHDAGGKFCGGSSDGSGRDRKIVKGKAFIPKEDEEFLKGLFKRSYDRARDPEVRALPSQEEIDDDERYMKIYDSANWEQKQRIGDLYREEVSRQGGLHPGDVSSQVRGYQKLPRTRRKK